MSNIHVSRLTGLKTVQRDFQTNKITGLRGDARTTWIVVILYLR